MTGMLETLYRGRRAAALENSRVRVTILLEGGHVAEILDKETGVNPLWNPPWPTIEPSAYDPARHPGYGEGAEARLLAGIMGHNLCMDIFGGPSPEEAAAGLTVHGEASVARYEVAGAGEDLTMSACFPWSQLSLERHIRLAGNTVEFSETVENLAATDRPIAWTQHVTLGPPFLRRGSTHFEATATRSMVHEADLGGGKGYLERGAEFTWPLAPRQGGGTIDLRSLPDVPVSAAFTTHLMDPAQAACFVAWSPESRIAFGYAWDASDFPWLGIWEENASRDHAPWNGRTLARGMEFGASPMPETRREMIRRGTMFGVPCFRWIAARSRVETRYMAAIARTEAAPVRLLKTGDGARFA